MVQRQGNLVPSAHPQHRGNVLSPNLRELPNLLRDCLPAQRCVRMATLCVAVRRPISLLQRQFSLNHAAKQRRQTSTGSMRARLERVSRRLPPRLQKLTSALVGAPASHIISFLILHEMTALLPLIGLTAFLHYTQWSPGLISHSHWVENGVDRFRAYFLRKNWISEEDAASLDPRNRDIDRIVHQPQSRLVSILVVELGIAYALVKIALPARIALSVALTPWFARSICVPFSANFRRIWAKQK